MKKGFTIVELLIVIVVIAILAVITIVAYNGIQDRSRQSQAYAALSQSKKKLELYKVDNTAYPLTGNLAAADVNGTSSLYYQYTSDGTTYCLTASIAGKSFNASETSTPTSGSCSGHVAGGTIVNAHPNPSAESSTSGYAGVNGSTIASSSVRSKNGANSILATLPTQTASNTGVHTSSGYSIPSIFKANTTYTFSLWVYVPTGTVNVYPSVQGGGVASTSGCTPAAATAVKDSWARISCSFTSSASGSFALYALNATGSTAGQQFYVDSVMVTEGNALYNYADGSSANWSWNGAANNSASTGPPL